MEDIDFREAVSRYIDIINASPPPMDTSRLELLHRDSNKQAINEIIGKNQEWGRHLALVLGSDATKAVVFPTPLETFSILDKRRTRTYLVLTMDGYRVSRVSDTNVQGSSGNTDQSSDMDLGDIILKSMRGRSDTNSEFGYHEFDNRGTKGLKLPFGKNVTLAQLDSPTTAEEIIRLNVVRAKGQYVNSLAEEAARRQRVVEDVKFKESTIALNKAIPDLLR